MITLYINPTCPFCIKTVEVAKASGAPLTVKPITEPGVEQELIELGGKRQMPFMVDDTRKISMYESDDIMRYIIDTYAPRE